MPHDDASTGAGEAGEAAGRGAPDERVTGTPGPVPAPGSKAARSSTPAPVAVAARGRRPLSFGLNVVFNVLLPYACYRLLIDYDFASVDALVIAALFPVGLAVVELAAWRTLDTLTALSVVTIALGIIASQMVLEPRMALARDSLFSGAFALVLFGSLVARRPLAFFLCRKFAARHDAVLDELWFGRWRTCRTFRRTLRVGTAAWATLLLADAVERVVVAYTMPVPRATTVSHLASVLVFVVLVGFSVGYLRRQWPKIRDEFAEHDPWKRAAG